MVGEPKGVEVVHRVLQDLRGEGAREDQAIGVE